MYPKYSSWLHKQPLVWPSLLLLPTNMGIMYIYKNHNFKKIKSPPSKQQTSKTNKSQRLIHVVEFTCFLPPEHKKRLDTCYQGLHSSAFQSAGKVNTSGCFPALAHTRQTVWFKCNVNASWPVHNAQCFEERKANRTHLSQTYIVIP